MIRNVEKQDEGDYECQVRIFSSTEFDSFQTFYAPKKHPFMLFLNTPIFCTTAGSNPPTYYL